MNTIKMGIPENISDMRSLELWDKFKPYTKKELAMNIYVGNLATESDEDDLKKAFASYGQVESVTIIKDKFSQESRGFAFVEMPSKAEADAAIAGLNGKDMMGNMLNVNEARPRNDNRTDRGGKY